MEVSTLIFQMEFDLWSGEIPNAITNAVNELRGPGGNISRIGIYVVERSHGTQLRIEGRIIEGGENDG